ncbi:hypothetical protein [Streptomyces sp. NPDC002328]|uniref:hypothetical protein n=1 Tax=Streptomyces sp. NPDC002328 TaxID=3364642 RepID=UPI0036B2FF0D
MEEATMNGWGEQVSHRDDVEHCLCGCRDFGDVVGTDEDAPPADEYRITTR